MLEIIVDAFFFHQPRDEIKVAFTILHGVNPRVVGGGCLVFKIGEIGVAHDLFHNIQRRFILKYPAIAPEGQKIQRRAHFAAKQRLPAIAPLIGRIGAIPLPIAGIAVFIVYFQTKPLADNVFKAQIMIGRQELNICLADLA